MRNGSGVETGVSAVPLRIDPTGTTAQPVTDNGGSLTVDGTVSVIQSTSPWVTNISQFGGSNVVTGTGASGSGIPRVTVSNDSNILATQSGTWNINNISGTTSLPTGAATSANQTTEITSLQLIDNIIGPVTPGTVATNSALIGGQFNTVLPTLTNTQQSSIQLDSSGRLLTATSTVNDTNYGTVGANTIRSAAQIGNATGAANFNAGATGAQTLRTESNQGAPNTVANSWPIKLTDGTDTALITANSDLKVVDGVRNGGVYGALNIPTANTPVEAKVGAARLTNRKALIVVIENNGIFWGLDNTVTTTSGVSTANGQVLTFNIDPDSTFQVWLVGNANNKNVHVVEMP